MNIEILNQTASRVPQAYLQAFCCLCEKTLKKKKKWPIEWKGRTLQLVFLEKPAAQKLNFQFRKKNYATDVLSFESVDPSSVGELVMCPQVLKQQAQQHGLSFRDELSYMVLHGILHLMGYDHERNEKEAQVMFHIQDTTFEVVLSQMKSVK